MTARAITQNFPRQSRSKVALVAIFALVLTMLTVVNPSERAFAAGSPGITAVSPAAGPGGTAVTITGSGFSGSYSNPPVTGNTLKVSFRSALGTVTAMSSTSITVTAPTGTSGLADISVETPDGIITLDDAFLYRAALSRPTVSNVSPAISTLSANGEVVITGTGFVNVSAVQFGTTNAVSYRVESSSRIVAVVPAKTVPGNAQVFVTTPGGKSTSAFNLTYAEPCEISNYANVRFEYRSSKLTKATRKVLRDAVKEMVYAECGSVTLLRYNAKISSSTSASHKAYILLQRARANAVGDLVQTRLALLGSTARVSYAKFEDQKSQAAVANWDSRKSYRKVTIANRANSVPAITATYPNAGSTSGGTQVTIKGVNLSDVTAVRFGTTTATFSVVGDDQINVTAPAGSAGTASITVVAPTGNVTKSGAFRYAGAATITSLSTATSSVAGSTSVTINGTNFYGLNNVDSVRFGSVNASYFTVVSSTRIVATIPANTPGPQNISVGAAGGSDSETFTYRAAPTVTSISPTSGPAGGTTAVTITGSGFSGLTASSAVKFGNNNATSYTVSSGTSIAAVAPSGTSNTTVTVTVTNSGGSSVLKAAYTYGGVITPASQTVQGAVGTPLTATTAYVANSAFTTPIVYALSPTGTLPAGLSFSTSTGVISGTPSAGIAPTTFTVSATGANGVVASATITLAVAQLTPATQTVTGTVGSAITSTTALTKVGFPGTVTFTLTGGTLPAGLSFSTSTGVISGNPSAPLTETTFTVTGTSGTVSTTTTITLTVNAPA